jgi:hypothetical protein
VVTHLQWNARCQVVLSLNEACPRAAPGQIEAAITRVGYQAW